jgi:hypothetical protein
MGLLFFDYGKLKTVNSWRQLLFLLSILFWELTKHKLCQVDDSKLLEMLTHLLSSDSCIVVKTNLLVGYRVA